jgi:hypothetical protein
MNETCPNINTPEWKALVSAVGDGNANTAYGLNSNEIPTVEKAREILSKLKTEEKDEQFTKSSDAFKLERARAQMTVLERASFSANGLQKETLKKLIEMNKNQQEFLKNNIELARKGMPTIKTLSTSSYIGSSDFTGDAKAYEAFKYFGTFEHEVLELGQMESLKTGVNIMQILTREYFDSTLENYKKKNPFFIENLSEDEMYDMTIGLAKHIDVLNDKGYLILPEITVTGTTRTGTTVVGRIDLLLIDSQGRVSIFDFKTKKVKNLVYTDQLTGKKTINKEYAFNHLAIQTFGIDSKTQTVMTLKGQNRTAYDTWTLQTKVYENMLIQNGLNVKDQNILALMYQTTDEGVFEGSAIHMFEESNYYDYANTAAIPDNNGNWKNEPNANFQKIKNLRDTIDYEMPIADEAAEESKKRFDTRNLKLKSKQDVMLKNRLQESVNSELQQVLDKLSSVKKEVDPLQYEILSTRRETLRRFQDVLKRTENDSDLSLAVNFSLALDAVEDDLIQLSNLVNKAMESFKINKDSYSSKEGVKIREIYEKSRGIAQVFRTLQEIVTSAKEDPTNKTIIDETLENRLTKIYSALSVIEGSFVQVALPTVIQVLKSPGETVFVQVNAEMKEGLQTRLQKLEKELTNLQAGKPASLLKGLTHRALLFVDKDYKINMAEKMAEKYGEASADLIVQIQSKQKEILKVKSLIDGGLQFSDETLEKYINGVTDPASDYYAGSRETFTGSSLLSGLTLDKGIAGASNSDLAISAFTMMLKNAEGQARNAIQNSIAAMQFDQKRDKLLQRYSVNELNAMVSESRKFTFIDKKTGERRTINRLYMNKPYSEEYESTYREYNIKLGEFRKEIAALKVQNHTKKNTPEGVAAEKAYLDKVSEKEKYQDEYIQWMLDNARLPYVDKFYSLQKSMPNEIRDKLQKRYLEIETITFQVGKGNEVLLEEHDFERLEELEQEIRTLRKNAKDINPEYAEYMDDFNELFEWDTNFSYYERMRNNALSKYKDTHPEEWAKWQKSNEIVRPTKRPELPENLVQGNNVMYQDQIMTVRFQRPEGSVELVDSDGVLLVAQRKDLESLSWYERLSILYEQRAQFLSGDPEVEELAKERGKILSQYKVGGRLRPKFMSEDDVTRLDEIEGMLEMIYERKKNSSNEFTKEQRKELALISTQINNLVDKKVSQGYIDVFESNLKVLYGAQKELLKAENDLAIAKTNGDRAAIAEAQIVLNKAEANFGKEEKDFRKWYDLHHYNKYVSILTGHDVRQNTPKAYNMERLPPATLHGQYMEVVPHPKYKVKKIKESAKNPDFLQSAEGIPLPKAISKSPTGEFVITPGYENSANVSAKYKQMMNNPEVFSFYNDMMNMFFDLQQKVEGRKVGYMIPGFLASKIENITTKGVTGSIGAEYEKFKENTWRRQSAVDRVDGYFGELNGKLRHGYTEQLPENLQTKDAIGAIMKYSIEAHYNIAMQEVAPMADTFIAYFELMSSNLKEKIKSGTKFSYTDDAGNVIPVDMTKRLDGLENMLSITRYERNKHLYGQYESGTAFNKLYTKRLNMIFSYTSFIRIGFDVANQTKNYISGNVQAFIAAGGLDSDKYTRKDYKWAKGKVYGYDGFLHNYFRDYGRIGDVSESTMLYRFFNPAQKDFMGYMNEVSGTKKRKALDTLTNVQELGYLLQDKGDTEIAVTVMYSVLNHNRYRVIEKLDKDGKPVFKKDVNGEDITIPAHEIYYKDEKGLMQRRKDVEYDQADENRLRNIIYSEMRRTQGNYAKADQTKFEDNVVGKLVFYFRKYLVPQMLNRFGYLRPNWEGSEAAIGYWRAVAIALRYYGPNQVLKHWIYGSKHMSNTNQNKLGSLFTRKVAQAKRDAIFMAVLSTISMMALMYVRKKDDEDEELSMMEGNLIRILWGVQGETTSMFPIGGGSEEYIRNFTTLTTYTREFKAIKKTASHLIYYGVAMSMNGGEEPDPDTDGELYQDVWKEAFYSRKSGAYEKGDAKIRKDLMDLSGIKNFRDLIDPNYRIDQMKRNQ